MAQTTNEHLKIKLIFPCRFERNDPYSNPSRCFLPFGMGVLTSYLKKQGVYVEQDDLSIKVNARKKWLKEVRPADLYINNSLIEDARSFFKTNKLSPRLERVLSGILNFTSIRGFDIIGFSIFSHWHFILAAMLSSKIKKYTNTPIVFGGPFITLYGQFYPGAFEFVDFMIYGEGEIPFIQLARSLIHKTSFKRIPGLIYKHNGRLIMVPRERYSIKEMCMPDFEGLPLELYRSEESDNRLCVPYQISKGCNGTCSFCVTKRIDHFLEYKSYSKVVFELQQLKEKYGSNLFHFCDSSINSSYEYLERLCNAFIAQRINIYWKTYARIEHLDRVILEKMKMAGCQVLVFGMESGSDRILRLMRKGFTSMQAQMILREADELDIKSSICFISGYAHEREEDIKETADFIRRNKKYINSSQVYSFHVLYGSNIWKQPETYGIANLRKGRSRYYFTFDEIGGLRWQEKRIQQAHSNKQIKRVFKKYLVHFSLFHKLIYFAKSIFFIRALGGCVKK